mgnify:CR=1 FL=1|jgi:hypothetical protein
MDKDKLLELMCDYLNQYGIMGSFLQYCEDDCDLNKDEVEESIEDFMYGG